MRDLLGLHQVGLLVESEPQKRLLGIYRPLVIEHWELLSASQAQECVSGRM